MFSVVVCSHRPERAAFVRAHWADVFRGKAYELILIADARSLCEGYARGFAQARGDRVIFAHDDIELVPSDAPVRLARHLVQYDVVGIAGTDRVVDGNWTSAGEPHCCALVVNPAGPDLYTLLYAGAGTLCVGGMAALDGCFLACRREVVAAIGFDAGNFDGFHLYDADFTFRAHLAGYRLAVCRDLLLIHASLGRHDAAWRHYNERFVAKFRGRLSGPPGPPMKVVSARLTRAQVVQLGRPENLERLAQRL